MPSRGGVEDCQIGPPHSGLGEPRELCFFCPDPVGSRGASPASSAGGRETFSQPLPSGPRRGGSEAERGATLHLPAPLAPRRDSENSRAPPQAWSAFGAQGPARSAPPRPLPLSHPHAAREDGAGRPGIPTPVSTKRGTPAQAATPCAAPVAHAPGGPGAEPRPRSSHVGSVWSARAPLPRGCHIARSRSGRRRPRGPPCEPLRRGWADVRLRREEPQSGAFYPSSQINTHLGGDTALGEASSPDPAGRRRLRPPQLQAPAGCTGLAPYVSQETGSTGAAGQRPLPFPPPGSHSACPGRVLPESRCGMRAPRAQSTETLFL